MLIRMLKLSLVLGVLITGSAQAIEFEVLPKPTITQASWSITDDASRLSANFGGTIYILEDTTYTYVGQTSPSDTKTSISGDGSTIIANFSDSLGIIYPGILRESTGWQVEMLDTPEGYASCDFGAAHGYSLNYDATMATGLLWDGCAGKAFLWTEATGMQDLGLSRGSAISSDGSVIVGFQGGYRRPAYWNITGTTPSSTQICHDPEDIGEIFQCTSDGSVMVGTGIPYGHEPQLFGYQAFIYQRGDTTMSLLGTLSGSNFDISKATFIADNGVIVGVSGPTSTNVTAFIWTPEQGMTNLKSYLIDNGVDFPAGTYLTWPNAFSRDGSTLIVSWNDINGGWGYARVTFDPASAVEDLQAASSRLVDIAPNPFNPMTNIKLAVDRSQQVKVSVYDISGRRMAVLADRVFETGEHVLNWRGADSAGRAVASGSYVVSMETAGGTDSRTITLVR